VAMEPHNAVAWWEGDVLTVASSTQWAHGTANAIARDLKMPQSKVRVFAGDTGSGWGDKTGRHPYHIYTAMLAQKTGRPVRHVQTRKDMFYEQGHKYQLMATAKMGVKRDGTITALEGTSYVPSGGYGRRSNSDDWRSSASNYKIANVKINGFSAITNTVRTSALRTVGEPSGNFMTENLINRAAEAVNMDPLEFRLKNIETEVDQVNNLPYSSNGLREALERGAELFNWSQRWQGWKTQHDLSGPQRGIGVIGFECAKGGGSPPMTAVVQVETDGSVIVNSGFSLSSSVLEIIRPSFRAITSHCRLSVLGCVLLSRQNPHS
ncbi:MAG: molybdopterin-dependent oxidoreductase, partial [Planctomycetes bacterium]|nr:molybdopterin-dependent oxidoreductase [Planctomycetota bacterium]